MKISNLLQSAKKDKKLLEAEVLVGKILGKTREWVVAHSDEEVSSDQMADFHKLWSRLLEGEPLAYLINEKEFYGMKFYVDENVLVPRPETEALVEMAFELSNNGARKRSGHCANASNKNSKVMDVGTGCGAIACALAAKGLEVSAVEVSEEACDVARKNIKKLEVPVDMHCGNLLEPVKDKNFEIIVANLPYIGREKHHFISDDVDEYEPGVALYGGHDGLRLYEEMFQQILDYKMKPKYILGEVGFTQAEDLTAMTKKFFPKAEIEIKQDLSGLDRNFIIRC